MSDSTGSLDPVRVFRALGNRARLRMTQELSYGERCVADLVQVAALGWATVSRHLGTLRAAGIVDCEKRGNQVFYRLALPCVSSFAACLAAAARGGRVQVVACCE